MCQVARDRSGSGADRPGPVGRPFRIASDPANIELDHVSRAAGIRPPPWPAGRGAGIDRRCGRRVAGPRGGVNQDREGGGCDVTLPMPAANRVQQLRKMKIVATTLLLVAAAVFVVCVTVGNGKGFWGYLQTAAEAAMVGGLADWFAVTALFRYPLGLPIPHTAIIPRKKDQIGAALGTFVQQNFLTSSVVGERLAAARIPHRAGEWLAQPTHAA